MLAPLGPAWGPLLARLRAMLAHLGAMWLILRLCGRSLRPMLGHVGAMLGQLPRKPKNTVNCGVFVGSAVIIVVVVVVAAAVVVVVAHPQGL